jgi:hypothetical protein
VREKYEAALGQSATSLYYHLLCWLGLGSLFALLPWNEHGYQALGRDGF